MTSTRCVNHLILAAVALVLSACGGGGGGEPAPGPGPGPTPTSQTINIGDDQIIDEGSNGGTTDVEFSVTLDAAATSDVSVSYTTQHVTTEDSDLVTATGTVTISAGNTSTVFSIPVAADTAFELDEEFTVVLSNPSVTTVIGDGEATGTLVNDDALTVVIDVFYLGDFDATLGGRRLDVDYDLLVDVGDLLTDLGLTELLIPFDVFYQSDIHLPTFVASGNLQITLGGGSTGRLRIILPPGFDGFAIGGNFLIEFDWSAVFDNLPSATWEFFAEIEPQDVEPTVPLLSVADVNVFAEGNIGDTTDMTFVATVSQPLAIPLTLDYATIDGTAMEPQDYQSAIGSVTIAPGDSAAEFTVTANGDDVAEGSSPEFFIVSLQTDNNAVFLSFPWATGNIYDDDTTTDVRRISIQNSQLIEGDAGSANMEFDVVLNSPAAAPVTFRYATRNGTAEAGTDYELSSGERTFQSGESQLQISVPIFGDTDPEDNETFVVFVEQTFGNGVAVGEGIGTILTDDPIARVSILDLALAEGDSGTTTFGFTVMLSAVLETALDIGYETDDITATAGEDYVTNFSTITIPAGASEGRIDILVNGDPDAEDDEVFQVTISETADNAEVVAAIGQGTILNDDGSGGWAGEELVHPGSAFLPPQRAIRPQVGFGPSGERQVVFLQHSKIWHTVSTARSVWSDPVEIGPTTNESNSPRLVVDDSANAVVLAEDTFIASYSYNPSSSWQFEAMPMAVEVAGELQMLGDPTTGAALAVWGEPANAGNNNVYSIWSARFVPGTGWQDIGLIETGDGSVGRPNLALSANGDAIAVFSHAEVGSFVSDAHAYRLVSGSSTWVGPKILDDIDGETVSPPKVDINASGDAAVVWHQSEPATGVGAQNIYISRYDASSEQWTDPVPAHDETIYRPENPDVAIDADGNVFVVWLQYSTNFDRQDLYANRYDATANTWDGARLLELDDTADGFPINSQQVVADDFGNAIVVWVQDDNILQNVRAARYSVADGGWQPSELLEDLDTGDANIPVLVMDRASGDAMVVWHINGDGSSVNIWANRFTN